MNDIKQGYYLVHSSGRHFISSNVNITKFEKLANKVLTDKDYEYWIDYCYGPDVFEKAAWMNIDVSYKFES